MRKQFIGTAVAILAVAAFGCGGTSNRNETWTCNASASFGFCYEWSAPNYLNPSEASKLQQTLQENCTGSGLGDIFSTGANCPTTDRVGTCAVSHVQGRGVPENMVWYSPAHSSHSGQASCTSVGGTWTPG